MHSQRNWIVLPEISWWANDDTSPGVSIEENMSVMSVMRSDGSYKYLDRQNSARCRKVPPPSSNWSVWKLWGFHQVLSLIAVLGSLCNLRRGDIWRLSLFPVHLPSKNGFIIRTLFVSFLLITITDDRVATHLTPISCPRAWRNGLHQKPLG